MEPAEDFRKEREARLRTNSADSRLLESASRFMHETIRSRYSYNFEWLSRPIIQYPQDIVAIQELIWQVQPELIIETGIAHGGSLILSASMLALLDHRDAIEHGLALDPRSARRRVIGVDVDIRPHNRIAIESHFLSHRIDMIQGSSIAPDVVAQVHDLARHYNRILVFLDSNHTHEHVLGELESYAPLVSVGSYCVVFDTIIERLPEIKFEGRDWHRGNSPMTAVQSFLSLLGTRRMVGADGESLQFEINSSIDSKLLLSAAPSGYLRRVKPAVPLQP